MSDKPNKHNGSQEIDGIPLSQLCNLPGTEGCLWRLYLAINPNGITEWFQQETIRGTDARAVSHCLGSITASMFISFAEMMDNPKEALMNVPYGVVHRFQTELQAKVDAFRKDHEPGQIIRPGTEFKA